MKKVRYLLFSTICFLVLNMNVYAGAIELNISSTSRTVTKGNSVTVTAKISSSNSLFYTEGTLSCSGAGVNGSKSLNNDDSSNGVYTKSFSYIIKPTSVGTVTCSVTSVRATDSSSPNWQSINGQSITITVNAPYVAPPRQLSSNSYLSNLSVEGLELKETFSKETLEYTIDIPAETEKIKINAQLADSSAKVTGIGEINVSEGINNLSIVVTAENGSKRTYTLKATVLELEPIKVVIDGDDYTVVRKKKDLPKVSEFFSETEIDIDNKKIPGYLNEKLGYTLVGLKNDNGTIEMYIYKNNKYTLYREYTFNGMVLQVLDKEINKNYKKTSFVYDSNKIVSYQEVKLDILKNTYALDDNDISGNQFYLFYAINVETGKEAIYQYDATEKTVQRYNTLVLDMYKERSDKYYLYLLGSILILGIFIITFSTILICKKKKRSNR